jgi:hypothetical protein
MSRQTEVPQAGWYSDPDGGGGRRYWDGQRWTDARAPGGEPGSSADDPPTALVALGYLFAVLLPIIGLALGIVAATGANAANRRHGPWIVVLSILVGAVGLLIALG